MKALVAKMAVLLALVLLVALGLWRYEPRMRPIGAGNSRDFWYAACRVQVDPARPSKCACSVYPPRDGWFIYAGSPHGGISFHGEVVHRVPASEAMADFPAVVRALEEGQHLALPPSFLRSILDAGHRAWLRVCPERDDAHALIACINAAWHEADRKRDPKNDYRLRRER